MFGRTYDVDKSFSGESESPTHDVVTELKERISSLEIDNENLKEENMAYAELSLRPLVLKYEEDIKCFMEKMKHAIPTPGEVYIQKITSYDHEIQTMTQFFEQLLKGAHEHL